MDHQPIEKFIYKYRKLDPTAEQAKGELNENTMNYLINCEIFLAKATQFNDPFDCWIPIDLHCSKQELLDEIQKYGPSEKSELQELINKIGLERATSAVNALADLPDYSSKMMGETIERLRLHCFSRRYDSLLMWAHYANSHTGVCIGIRVENIDNAVKLKLSVPDETGNFKEFQFPVVDVEYSNDNRILPPYRYYEHERKIGLEKYLTYKSKEWAYEEELRLVLWNEELTEQKIHLAPNSIGEVIFGIRTPKAIIKEVISKVLSNNSHGKDINFYQMERSSDMITLEKVRLELKDY
jgi:hypothetical protein